MHKSKKKSLHGQTMMLLPDRALFWEEKKLLIVADPHFGKAQIFRDKGIPIPGGTTCDDLTRLSGLMDRLNVHQLLFLGDLIHGRIANPSDFNRLVDQWRQRHRLVQFFLSTGNHDLRSGNLANRFRFDHVAAEIKRGPFVFSHKPRFDRSLYGFAGHLHPAVTLTGNGGLKETLPCFCFGPRAAMLPAFGSFTGTQVIRPSPEDHIYVVAGDEVVEMENRISR